MEEREWYQRLIEPRRRALEQLRLELDFFLRDAGDITIYNIHHRMKEFESAHRKASSKGVPLEELDDLAGLRIIVGTKKEVPIIEYFFKRQEDLIIRKDLEILKREELDKPDGYRALHLVVELKSHYKRSIYPGRVEIQIQTVFAHAFNFLSRAWRYKQQPVPSSIWHEYFTSLSKNLSIIEESASQLYDQVVEVSTGENEESLTPHSLQLLTNQEFEEKLELEAAVDLCVRYRDIGYKTNGELRDFFRSEEISRGYKLIRSNRRNNKISALGAESRWMFWFGFRRDISYPDIHKYIEFLESLHDTRRNTMKLKIDKISEFSWEVLGYTLEGDRESVLGEIFNNEPDVFIYRIEGEKTGLQAASFEDAKTRLFDLIKKKFGDTFK